MIRVESDHQHRIYVILERVVWWSAIIFFSLLSILNFFFTTERADGYKGAYIVKFTPISTVTMIFVTVVVIFIFFRLCKEVNIELGHVVTVVFLLGLIESMFWVFIADVGPAFDSLDLVYATEALMGNIDGLAVGKWAYASYLSRFPYQTSIVCLLYFCMSVAGENYVIFFEIINCFACAFAMTGIVKLANEISEDKNIVVLAGFLATIFIPMVLYCTFIYGNVIALPFLIYSLYFQKRFLKGSKKTCFCLLMAIVLMGIAVFIKSTMIIGALAESCIYLFWALNERQKKKILLCVVCIICTLKAGSTFLAPINFILESKANIDLDNGVPSIAWITMGLGGGLEYQADMQNDSSLAMNINDAGYYDGFVWALSENEYSKEAMNTIATKYLTKRIQHFMNNPVLMLRYMVEKFMIEWTSPDYEAFLASNWDSVQANGYNQAERQLTRFAGSFYYGEVHNLLLCIMDTMQTILSVGTLCWLLLNKEKIAKNVEVITVLGYVAVYILWENKTQYMFPAYLLMIPVAVKGWELMHRKIMMRVQLHT